MVNSGSELVNHQHLGVFNIDIEYQMVKHLGLPDLWKQLVIYCGWGDLVWQETILVVC